MLAGCDMEQWKAMFCAFMTQFELLFSCSAVMSILCPRETGHHYSHELGEAREVN